MEFSILIIENQRLSLLSTYVPNEDHPEFYGKIAESMDDLENKHVIFVGDFNLVIKPELDYSKYLHINNPKAREKVAEIINKYHDLTDIYRELKNQRIKIHMEDYFLRGLQINQDMLNFIGMINCGFGETHVTGLLAALNIPTITQPTFKSRECEIACPSSQ